MKQLSDAQKYILSVLKNGGTINVKSFMGFDYYELMGGQHNRHIVMTVRSATLDVLCKRKLVVYESVNDGVNTGVYTAA